jgi:hypothetical protein
MCDELAALAPPLHPVPHVELLCYRGIFARCEAATDVAAMQLVFAVPREAFEPMLAGHREAVVGAPFVSDVDSSRARL